MMSEQIWELHRQGKLKVLAVASEQRLSAIPDLPTAVEQGYPDLVARLFFGLFAPAKTPKPIIAKVEQATQVAMQDPALKQNFQASGYEMLATADSAAAADYIAKEIVRWRPILAQLNSKPQ
jgi:tripartite-type tricarboxylate transporter receptor subunit TctC